MAAKEFLANKGFIWAIGIEHSLSIQRGTVTDEMNKN